MKKKQALLILLVFIFLLKKVESDDYCSTSFDSHIDSICTGLTINSTHHCIYSNGKCDFNYQSCVSYTGKDETICKAIIPSSKNKKCEIVSESCSEVDKTCDEYEEGKGMTCSLLKAGDNKRCYLNLKSGKCEAHYSLCSNFKDDVDKSKCEANIPSDSTTKCEWDNGNGKCEDVDKKCNDYSGIYYNSCSSLKTTDDTNKICMTATTGNGCVEQYKTCELYNTKASPKTKSECEALMTYSGSGFDDSKICEFSGNTCSTRDKSCQDMIEEDSCIYFTPSDNNKICIYNEGECKEQYKTCDLYNKNAKSKSKTDCESLRIYSNGKFDDTKICIFSSDTCSERDKTCEDITDVSECEYFQPNGGNIICILNGGQCKPQYKTCELYNTNVASKNSDDCLAIKTYSDTLNKFDDSVICTFDSDTCSERDKLCSDLTDETSCLNFSPKNTNKRCIYSGGQCKEQYKTCELYSENASPKSEDECLALKLYNIYGSIDTSSECKYDTSSDTCSTKKKPCSSFTTSSTCNNHELDEENKMCIFINGECKESYKTCELYEKNTSAEDKNKNDCEKITPYNEDNLNNLDTDSICVFTENKCTRKAKDCSEFTSYSSCYYHTLDDENKMCIYENHQCKEVYKSCSAYNNFKDKSEAGCKALTLYNSGVIDYSRICIYESGVCTEKTLSQCSDYVSGKDENYCTNIPSKSYKKCVFKNNNCVEEFTDCPGNNEDVSEDICTAIVPSYEYNKCTMNNNKCVITAKSCTEYKGSNYYYCEYYLQPGTDKKCFFENGKCIEKDIYCEKYTGNNKAECESIIPYSEGNYPSSLKSTHKCSMEEEGCKKVEKKCEEAESSNQCTSIYNTLKSANKIDSKKECKYINGNCIEEYKTCEDYASDVEKDICESIILDNNYNKCEYVSGEPNTCVTKGKLCSDVNPSNYQYYCKNSIQTTIGKKCVYSNAACKESNMSCKELENNSRVTSDICSAAPTSGSNKKCELKSDKTGCQETDKPNNDNKSNLGPEFKFSLFIVIFALLI